MSDVQLDPFPGPDPLRFPNTRRRVSAPGVDDTASSRPNPPDMHPFSDPDTCRICRGEGTADEQLFYPCKCSGSIKYVHQDCLMEWLSHSQKKHCELCKTPFRFTKLYDPDMPKSLPPHVFISHMARYLFRNLLVWLRAGLVASVWLGWLPYLMRSVWSFLFWISDEGLGGGTALFGRRNDTGPGGLESLPVMSYGSGVCPSSPLFAATTTVATIGGVINDILPDSTQLVKGLYGINLSSTDPLYSTILRLLFGTMGLAEKPAVAPPNSTASVFARVPTDSSSHQSLLSGVAFLRNLTRHASVNRVIIAVLEGQIITILVIICFILIILVRDYVVQQQPEINMRAAFAAVENPPLAPVPAQDVPRAPAQAAQHMVGPRERPFEAASDNDTDQQPLADHDEPTDRFTVGVGEEGPSSPFRRRQPSSSSFAESSTRQSLAPILESNHAMPDPGFPASDMLDSERTTVHEYLGIYREASGDPERILRIARERHLEDKLDYWIKLTRSMMDRDTQTEEEGSDLSHAAGSSRRDALDTTAFTNSPTLGLLQEDGLLLGTPQNATDAKGKGRLTDDVDEHYPAVGPLRPRANTDGPTINHAINPLANNNWSFVDLPSEPEPASTTQSFAGPLFPDYRLEENEGDHEYTHSRLGGNRPARPPSPPAATSSNSSQRMGDPQLTGPEPNILDQDHASGDPGAVPEPRPVEAQAPPHQPMGIFDRVTDFMWRHVDAIDPAELAAAEFLDEFDDHGDGAEGAADQVNGLAEDQERDREAVEAAVEAGLDPEAIEDAEDLEGILELLGMRGPVAGLFQNAIFCAFLVSITIFLGIFLPYNIGRVTVWTLANPVRPARMLISLSKFVQDCVLVVLGLASYTMSQTIQLLSQLIGLTAIAESTTATTTASLAFAVSAANRIGSSFMTEFLVISGSEMRNFSAISHEALLAMKQHISLTFSTLWQLLTFLLGGNYSLKGPEAFAAAANVSSIAVVCLKELPTLVTNPSSWVLNLSLPETTRSLNPELAYWDGMDRFWAIIAGYIALCLVAGLYLRRGTLFSTGQTAQEWEATIIDGLNQASGVMKVILIIGIEMLVFPLYCGMLLDVALLPLFENASLRSRFLFTVNYPVTSIFVHWFIGTGYMFHFALFVSMYRKIMRKGVLYFIRDPDDPEFHPVRDVLERNVTTQLRKILFSALVYGALVIVCLGGVVWGLFLALPGILPIHYSSNEPVLEFPIDLLFYNFLMPMAVNFFRPSDGLHAMYTWWFRRCARTLRITWFLFGERQIDEEGRLVLKSTSPDCNLPPWKRLFLEVDPKGEVVARTSWRDIFEGGTAKPGSTIPADLMRILNAKKMDLVRSGQLIPDGRFVRTPASDQVKIPKGRNVFLDVTENNIRQDGKEDQQETDIYSTDQYQFVYVPPHFRARIFLFTLFIWIFAAVTGVSITIVPLLFGRWMFNLVIPPQIRTNDIYAFSIGIYVLGAGAYALFHAPSIYGIIKAWVGTTVRSAYRREATRRVYDVVVRAARVAYTYFFLLVVFPLLIASLMELYALIPLHEVMYGALLSGDGRKSMASGANKELNPAHTTRVVQAWTIGLLYLKLGLRIIKTWFPGTRLATAVRAVLRRGWLDPDLAVLSRAFIIPGLAMWVTAVVIPLVFAKFTVDNGLADAIIQASGMVVADGAPDQALYDAYLVLIYRLSFPFLALSVASCVTLWSVVGVFRSWQVRIRDEAYLIGERLHNFSASNGTPRPKGAWRAGGARI
ncbi:putative E3 ubiquitin ligase SUD1 [Madurella mycetomatis]|uniref:RING-type E3 ubiquitin transferase n=1 Tax=Madurella mycetomatis TaxID=100816 RepID=A0A175WE85_9PEZI|nr:putative E3 ubiquitin ligase SUD1 [Madurella mycetomatis]